MTTIDPRLVRALRERLGETAVLGPDAVAGRGAGVFRSDRLRAGALVRPADTAGLSATLALCHAHGQPVVAHGGLTGLVHGAEAGPDEVIVSLERMNRIESVDPVGRTAVAQAGAVVAELHRAAQAHGLHYGVDFGARGTATVGGSISTNAGGNSVIRYGMTRESVLGLEAVLADGTVVSSMNRMLKNNSGFDLKQLFIGTEGTLGIVARAVLRLHEPPGEPRTVLAACSDFDQVLGLLRRLDRAFTGRMLAYEAMWRDYVELATAGAGRSPFAAAPAFAVLAEVAGASADEFEAVLESAAADGLVEDLVLAGSLEQRAALWALRESVARTFDHGPPLGFDVSLPLDAMAAYTASVRAAVRARWPAGRCWIFGHVADGNLHVVVSVGRDDDAIRREVEPIVYEPLRAIGGAVSAEHGIGLEKKAWLGVTRSPEEIALMAGLKRALDPKGLLNRGKVVDAAS